MYHVSVIATPAHAKEVIFELRHIFDMQDWTYQYFEKISDYFKTKTNTNIVILDEEYYNDRVRNSIIFNNEQIIIIINMEKEKPEMYTSYQRFFYIQRNALQLSMDKIKKPLLKILEKQNYYLLSYNGVEVKLKINDIYYIEKIDKNVYYHTKQGVFSERGSMKDKEELFKQYDFIRIHTSYLVNFDYIFKIENDILTLNNKEELPVSRSNKNKVMKYFRDKIKQ